MNVHICCHAYVYIYINGLGIASIPESAAQFHWLVSRRPQVGLEGEPFSNLAFEKLASGWCGNLAVLCC